MITTDVAILTAILNIPLSSLAIEKYLMMHHRRSYIICSILVAISTTTCGPILVSKVRQQYRDANSALHARGLHGETYLKAHLHNGQLAVFEKTWNMDTTIKRISGTGLLYDMDRNVLTEGFLQLNLDSVALFETNKPITGRDRQLRATLITIGVLNGLLTGFCALNPKACFGSCPTFYLPGDEGLFSARAEGFSSAIHPGAQYADMDHISAWRRTDGSPEVIMKNEALETHVVDRLWLKAFPRIAGEQVYMDQNDKAWRCGRPVPSNTTFYGSQDPTQELLHEDGLEWWGRASEHDLRDKEILEMHFPRTALRARKGVAITYRQTLMSTFLLYTALGYMGHEAGDHLVDAMKGTMLARLAERSVKNMQEVEVQLWSNGRWQNAGSFHETGPIAMNRLVVPLPDISGVGSDSIRIRFILTPGMYRFDHIGLVDLVGEAHGEDLQVVAYLDPCGEPGNTASLLTRDDLKLCSLPGDVHRITFQLPSTDAQEWDLFLGADGYYLEWMRAEWIERTDPDRLKAMMLGDNEEWKALTNEYRSMEESMDEIFWNSQHTSPL